MDRGGFRQTLPLSPSFRRPEFKINENQLALKTAILELTLWVEQRGSAEVAGNVRCALQTIDKSEKFIKMSIAVLMAPE